MHPSTINNIYHKKIGITVCLLLLIVFVLSLQVVSAQSPSSRKQAKQVENLANKIIESESVFIEGMREYELENYPKALDFFSKSLQLNSQNAAANYMISNILVRQNNLFKAIEFAQKAIELEPKNKYYYLLLADIYERKQDFVEAAKTLNLLLKNIPSAYEANYDLAIVYQYLNKLEDAIKCFDRLEKIYGVTEELSNEKQKLYLRLNKPNEVINEAKKLAQAYPDETRYQLMLAETYLIFEKHNEAEKILNSILIKEPSNAYVHKYMHDIYLYRGNEESANNSLLNAFKSNDLNLDTKVGILISKVRQMYTESHKQNCLNLANLLVEQYPNESKVYAMRADILVLSGKNEMALVDYLKSTKLENTNYKIWEQIVIIEQELNMVDSLIKHSEAALELFPNQASFWFYNGLAHQMKKNYKKSVISFEEGRKLSMNNKNLLVQFYTLLGDTYNSLKDFKKSDENFEEALKIDENNFLVLNNYSYYLSLRRDKLEYAKKMSERVIKEFPDNANYLDTYAWVLYVMKDYIKAKEIFEKIVNNTDNGVIVEHYGDVLYQLGEKDLALEQWRKAKTLGETSDLIDKKISDKKLYE